jgi:hypothetical protein
MGNFHRALAGLRANQMVIPVLRAALSNPRFKGFDVRVRGWEPRPFDGWFHPSTHSNWTARQLTLYLRHGAVMELERPSLLFVAAVTQGSFWHNFNQRVLLQEGVLRRNPGTTMKDSIEKQCEIPLLDPEHNRRGHADGSMFADEDELFEFKTMTDRIIAQFTDENVLREKKPEYYSQTQDYLDISGKSKMRYFIMSLASPFPMQEFIVHADQDYQAAQRAKYREAIAAAQEDRLPEACCAIRSAKAKSCPLRDFCPIGRVQ